MKSSKLGSMLLALSLAAQIAVPAAMAADTANVYNLGGKADSKLVLTVKEQGCLHGNVSYTDNGDGTHNKTCGDCDELLDKNLVHVDADVDSVCDDCGADMKSECGHTASFRDNKDGTHSEYCTACGDALSDPEEHEDADGDGLCDVCNAGMESDAPILIATVPLQLPVLMDETGDIIVSSDAAITNVQERAIAVESMDVFTYLDWQLVPCSYDLSSVPNDTHAFSLSFRGFDVADEYDGSLWTIPGDSSVLLNMRVDMPRQTVAAEGVAFASVTFVLGWAEDDVSDKGETTLNRQMIFNDFVRFVQSDEDYYKRGKPSTIGVIEDMCAYMGVSYKSSTIGNIFVMHDENLDNLREYVENSATAEQLQDMIDVTNGGSIPRG